MRFIPFVLDAERSSITVTIEPLSQMRGQEGGPMSEARKPAGSDAEWYCRKAPEAERFYEIFFQLCQKYNVRWASAGEKEQQFIEEVTRVTYEHDQAKRLGLPLEKIREAFVNCP